MVATAVPTIVSNIVSQDMAGIGVKARFADANFTNASPRYLVYNNKWPSAEAFAGGVLATRRINGRLFAQIEPSVQCVITENKDFDDNDWTKINSTISSNAVSAPDGVATADGLIENSDTAQQYYALENITPDGSSVYCFSVYAKAKSRSWLRLTMASQGFPASAYDHFNISLGSLGTRGAGCSDSGIEYVNNDWYRCWIRSTSNAAASTGFIIYLASADNTVTYNGDGTSGAYLWLPQLIKESYPSSPIHTEAVAVTRNADELYWASASVPGALRGDIKIDLIPKCDIAAGMSGGDRSIIEFDESGASNNIHVYLKASDGKIYVDDETGASNLVTTGAVTAYRGQKVTVQLKPSAGQVVLSGFTTGNGTTTGTSWSTSAGNVYFLQTEANTQQWDGLGSEPY